MAATKPKVIFQNSHRRIVAMLNELGSPQLWFENSHGRDGMGEEAWLHCDETELKEFAKDLAIELAKEKLP